MKRISILLAALLAISGCGRGPAIEVEGNMDLIYERLHGQGSTTDYLHITTDTSIPKIYSWRPGQVESWIYHVDPRAKKEFMRQLASSLKRNRVDLIGKRTTTFMDVSAWRLQIHGAGLNIEAVILQIADPEDPDALWRDRQFTAMRNFMSDVRLMAELHAERLPERLRDVR